MKMVLYLLLFAQVITGCLSNESKATSKTTSSSRAEEVREVGKLDFSASLLIKDATEQAISLDIPKDLASKASKLDGKKVEVIGQYIEVPSCPVCWGFTEVFVVKDLKSKEEDEVREVGKLDFKNSKLLKESSERTISLEIPEDLTSKARNLDGQKVEVMGRYIEIPSCPVCMGFTETFLVNDLKPTAM